MSIECSECERDLRGGHAKTCSRFKTGRRKIPADGFCDQDINTQDSGTYVRCFGSLRTITPELLECRKCGTKYNDDLV